MALRSREHKANTRTGCERVKMPKSFNLQLELPLEWTDSDGSDVGFRLKSSERPSREWERTEGSITERLSFKMSLFSCEENKVLAE